MFLKIIILLLLLTKINSYPCSSGESFLCTGSVNGTLDCNQTLFDVVPSYCTQVEDSIPNDVKNKYDTGDVQLSLHSRDLKTQLSIELSFHQRGSRRIDIKLWENVDINFHTYACEQITFQNERKSEMDSAMHRCSFKNSEHYDGKAYVMEIIAQENVIVFGKRILFSIPDLSLFDDSISLMKRKLFVYIDFTNTHKLLLKIQQLPPEYNVFHYKVQIFRGKDERVHLVDEQMISPDVEKRFLDFEFLTNNEEGYYSFGVSALNLDCPDNFCQRTFTSRLYIGRKSTRLIIGIVGASFLIPFILYIFYIWSCRYRYPGDLSESVEKTLILFNPSFEKHKDVVVTLSKTIKHITGIEVIVDPLNMTKTREATTFKWCSDNLILASYIIYLAPPVINDVDSCGLDFMTYAFLKKEVQNSNSEKTIIVVQFPYATGNLPSILAGCPKFELMKDFSNFIGVFQTIPKCGGFAEDLLYKELGEKIKIAHIEAETLLNDVPKIVIEKAENAEDSNEIDGLL